MSPQVANTFDPPKPRYRVVTMPTTGEQLDDFFKQKGFVPRIDRFGRGYTENEGALWNAGPKARVHLNKVR